MDRVYDVGERVFLINKNSTSKRTEETCPVCAGSRYFEIDGKDGSSFDVTCENCGGDGYVVRYKSSVVYKIIGPCIVKERYTDSKGHISYKIGNQPQLIIPKDIYKTKEDAQAKIDKMKE
jgi:phage/plasmid primase-like uncharacterized protein